jgi:membrane protein implicated in regulation of membrane protease activity
MTWWMWLVFGFSLLLFEVLAPAGFYLFFFGLSAIVVSMLVAAEVSGPLWMQGLLFAIFAVAGLVLFRQPLIRRLHRPSPGKDVDSLIGETAVAMSAIPVDGISQVELRGSTWSARNVGPSPLAKGQRARVERVDGLTLWVRGQ